MGVVADDFGISKRGSAVLKRQHGVVATEQGLLETEDRSGRIDPRDVQDRRQLSAYLDQSSLSEYIDRSRSGEVAQKSTFLKSYLVEGHLNGDGVAAWMQSFSQVLPRRDPELLLLIDEASVAYFADLSDDRFIIVHTIGKTDSTDRAIEKLIQSGAEGFDRAWLPTDLLYGMRLNPLRGFKFGHQFAVSGISLSAGERELLREGEKDVALEGRESNGDSPTQNGDVHTEGSQRTNEPGGGAISRLAITNTVTAEVDYLRIREARVFEGRQALDSIQFVARDDQNEQINSTIYANGKVVGSGTSLGLHMLVIDRVRTEYSRVVKSIEDQYAIGWVDTGSGWSLRGEPLIVEFPDGLVSDLGNFVDSLFRCARPFRLFGIQNRISNERIDVEAIDLHTRDPLSLEITKSWMRVYLPRGSCGNIVTRLLTNLQHAAHSDVQLIAGTGEIVIVENTLRDG